MSNDVPAKRGHQSRCDRKSRGSTGPRQLPFGPLTFTAGCHVFRNTQAPQARVKLLPCLLSPGPGPDPPIRSPLEVRRPPMLGRVVVVATSRPPFRARLGAAPLDSAPAQIRDRLCEADLLLHLSSFLVDCIGSNLLLQLVFLRRGSVLRGRRGCNGRIRCFFCCIGRRARTSSASSPASSRIDLRRPCSAACQYTCRQTGNSHGNGSCAQPTAKASRRVVHHPHL